MPWIAASAALELVYFVAPHRGLRPLRPEPRLPDRARRRAGARARRRRARRGGPRRVAGARRRPRRRRRPARARPPRPGRRAGVAARARDRRDDRRPTRSSTRRGSSTRRRSPYLELVLLPVALAALLWHVSTGQTRDMLAAETGGATVAAGVSSFARVRARARRACRSRRPPPSPPFGRPASCSRSPSAHVALARARREARGPAERRSSCSASPSSPRPDPGRPGAILRGTTFHRLHEMGAQRPFLLRGHWPRGDRDERAPTHANARFRTRSHLRSSGGLPGVEVLAVELLSPSRFCVYVDHPDGVDHALCERVTRLLDAYRADFTIDVSSPGAGAPAAQAGALRVAVGRRVALRTERARSDGEPLPRRGRRGRATTPSCSRPPEPGAAYASRTTRSCGPT